MSAKAHILIISSWYPTPEKPFLGNFVRRQAELLSKSYQVTVIHAYASEDKTELQEKNDLFRELILPYKKSEQRLSNYLRRRSAYTSLLKKIKRPDLIIGIVAIPSGAEFLRAKKRYHCPLIYMEHGSFFNPEGTFRWTWPMLQNRSRLARESEKIIAVSEALREDMKAYFPNRTIEVISNHIDTEKFSLKEKQAGAIVQFLHVSTLDANKNPRGILLACKILRDEGIDFRLAIISDEPLDAIRSEILQLGLQNYISCEGPLKWEELPGYYHRADAFILFSNYETFSIVLAEAFACGTPVISTATGIMLEADEKHGFTIEKNSPTSLASAMKKMIEGQQQFDQKELRAFGEHYSAEKVLAKWDQLIAGTI